MDNTIKSLIARVWKNEALQLDAGEHFFDEVLMIHVSGTVTKQSDQMAAPTTSLPPIPILALVSAIRKADQQPVALVCAMQENDDQTITPVPFAVMVEGNPFELYEDPTV